MDVEKIFWAAQIILMLVFAGGVVNLIGVWRKSARTPARPGQVKKSTLLRSLGSEGWFNRRLFGTDKWRWAAHFLLINGVLLTMALSAFSVLFERILPLFPGLDAAALRAVVGRDQPLKAILNETGSLLMTLGWLIFAVRRYLFRPAQLRTNLRDHVPAIGLGLILLTGWLLEAVRINAEQTVSRVSYIGYPLAQAISGLPLAWEGFFEGLFLFHGLLATLVVATIPYTKWMHMLAAGITTTMSSIPARPASPVLPYTLRQRIEMEACTRCGECIPWCPTYQEKPASQAITPLKKIEFTQRERDTAGRQGLLGLGGRPSPAGAWQEHSRGVFDCTLCGRCAVVCPVHIQTRDLWLSMRAELNRQGLAPAAVTRLGSVLSAAHNLAGDESNDRTGWSQNLERPVPAARPGEPVDVLYFVGCVSSQYPQAFSIPQSIAAILERSGVKYGMLGNEEWCCGFPLLTAGLGEEAAALARHNLEAVRRSGAKTLLTGCPSCYRMWKETYPALLGAAPDIEILHSTAWLEALISKGGLQLKELDRTVTFHDPCDLGRGSGLYEAPRRVLEAVPGLRLVEMLHNRERALCCGGGGDVEMVDESLSAAVARHRMEEAVSSGAEQVVTACQQCVRTLSAAARTTEGGLRVVDLTTLIAKQLA